MYVDVVINGRAVRWLTRTGATHHFVADQEATTAQRAVAVLRAGSDESG